ncbi:ABC transporter permease subunit [Guptibacillus hwajinpoensis]|uniref:Peptide/nickel transport system permease protein n=1 Tax=Guptibacillus hwajinpoensis TaxID=208199 RepID=A0ABU0K173_9BACL|nr:ABC transporter permease subunit [Alkalihalobacillus hemicentroti]MDQ0483112.1 peptide/nickel transport system permease protein [Alkalihalobacillus hemicentroti]
MRKLSLVRNIPLLIGGSFILLLLLGSILYGLFSDPQEPQKVLLDENNRAIALAPFPPSLKFPLGSDLDGNNFVLKILEGAKFTIGLSILIAFLRMIVSFVGGYVLYLLPSYFRRILDGLANALHYAPVTIFTYVLIAPVIISFSWSYDTVTKIVFPVLVLIFVSVPVLSIYIQNELHLIAKREFIESAKVMGGSRLRIFRKHMAPFLYPKLFVVFIQQVGQVLIVFAHLGLLNVFIGGSDVRILEYDYDTGEATIAVFSMSNEWAGLIGQNFQYISSFPWMVLAPVTAFALTILAVNCVVYGLTNRYTYRRRRKRTSESITHHVIREDSFYMKSL